MNCDCLDETERVLVHACMPHYYVWLAFTCDDPAQCNPRHQAMARAMVPANLWPAEAQSRAPARGRR